MSMTFYTTDRPDKGLQRSLSFETTPLSIIPFPSTENEYEQNFQEVGKELDLQNRCRCGKGVIESIDLGVRIMRRCTVCNFRETKK